MGDKLGGASVVATETLPPNWWALPMPIIHLRRVQRVDLRSMLVLQVKHPSRQRQHAAEDNLTEQASAALRVMSRVTRSR